jgi:1-aminocyclopropane-1-carboxylate deaminase/D-cysteine desulfhydrase-like pyridoxal-dependent ACC family enzyme
LKENKQQGADSGPPKFEPVAFLRKAKEIKDEMESPSAARSVCVATSATTAEAGFAAAIKWTMHMDPSSVETQRVSEEEREAARAEEKRKKDVERTDKKATELKAKAEEAAKAAAAAKAVGSAH